MAPKARLLDNRYEVREQIGEGRTAVVHLGYDVALGRTVAIKILRSELAHDEAFGALFRSEVQNTAALNFPAIASVYDSGADPEPYFVLEHVDGRTLAEVLAGEQVLPLKRALEIMADVNAALEFGHRHGVVHLDINPRNVMLTTRGQVKIIDYGSQRPAGTAVDHRDERTAYTAQYMSPELTNGRNVDARSDVYSAGCLLFELLTGRPPFRGNDPDDIAHAHLRQAPPAPSQLGTGIPSPVELVALQALAKEPEDRYQSSQELRADLLRCLAGREVLARPAPAPQADLSNAGMRELEARIELLKREGDSAIRDQHWTRLTALRQEESAVALELLRRFRATPPSSPAPAPGAPPRRPDRGGRLPDRPRSAAILIGTSAYDDPDLPDIPAVTNNLRDLAGLLAHGDHGGFDLTRIHLAENPGREVGDEIAELAETVEDTLFVYFAGHGMTGGDGELYLGLKGTKRRRPMYSGLPYHELRTAVADSPARNKVVVLDCCYAGRAIGLMSGDEADGVIDVQGSYVITSTSAVQRAHAPEGARYSAFTGELVALLAEGSAESGSLIRLDDIYAHLRQRLTGRGLPKPQQRGVDTAADLALTRNPAWSAPPAAHRRR
jgi:serine/threonine protein kinase